MQNRKFVLKWKHLISTNVLSCPFVSSGVFCFEVSSSRNEQPLSRDHCPSKISLQICKKKKLFRFTLLWERNFWCISYYILEILKYLNATKVFRCKCCSRFLHPYTQHVWPALCFCYSYTKVIDTTAAGTHWPQCVMYVAKGARWAMEGVRRSQGQQGGGEEVCYISQGSRRLFTDIGLGLTER